MIRRLGRHIKEGFYGIVRHGGMSLSSASAVSITLIIISIFAMLTFNMQNIAQNIEGSVKISALVAYDSEDLESDIQEQISAISGVADVEFSDKEAEFDYYVSSFDEEEQEIFTPYKEDNPFHDAFYIEVSDGDMLTQVANQIAQIEGISGVNYGGESATTLINTMNNIKYGGLILVIALSLLAIYLVQNTIKITISSRSKEIWIMRNVGAKNGYIRAPFLVEGILIGFLGAIIPILITIFGYIYLYNFLGGILLSNVFVLIPPHPFILEVSLGLLGLGVIVGFLGSYISVSKSLRWRR